MKINSENLITMGYKEFPKTCCMNEYCNRFFQKAVKNKRGDKKYYITFFEYGGGEEMITYEVEMATENKKYNFYCINNKFI